MARWVAIGYLLCWCVPKPVAPDGALAAKHAAELMACDAANPTLAEEAGWVKCRADVNRKYGLGP